jgi:hypothetical protein
MDCYHNPIGVGLPRLSPWENRLSQEDGAAYSSVGFSVFEGVFLTCLTF